MHIVLFELENCITSVSLLDFAFVAIITSQYWACTRRDHESSCIHDWRARKDKIACKVELEDSKFDSYCAPHVFCDWLADIVCYIDWYRFSDANRILFARRKLVGSVRSYWELVERLHET